MNKVLLYTLTRWFKGESDWKFFYVFEPSDQKKQESGVAYYCLVFKDVETFNRKVAWEKVDADIVFWLREKTSERWPWISWLFIDNEAKQSFWVNMYPNRLKGPWAAHDFELVFKDAEYRERTPVAREEDAPF